MKFGIGQRAGKGAGRSEGLGHDDPERPAYMSVDTALQQAQYFRPMSQLGLDPHKTWELCQAEIEMGQEILKHFTLWLLSETGTVAYAFS